MKVILRNYQGGAIQSVRGEIRSGKRRVLMVAPTGAGKTTIAGAIIDGAIQKGKKIVFLAHRTELIDQCSERLDDLEVPHGIIQRKHARTDPYQPVQVASIQTLIRRDHWDADIVVVDEAHRSTSPTYQKIIERYDDPVVLGLTATPYRMDGQGLGDIYDSLIEVATTQELIEDGHLIQPTVYGAPSVDLSAVKTQSGDFEKRGLAEAMQTTILHGDLLKNWLTHCGKATGAEDPSECNACTVVFAPSVEQSYLIVEQFKAAGVSAEHLDAKTPNGERRRILRALRERRLSVVSNVGILTEGWDLPHLECVILARPTRSKSLYKQMVGRLMRPDDDKRFAYLLDHANATRMHGFVNEPEHHSLKGKEDRPRKGAKERNDFKECKGCNALCPIGSDRCEECGYIFEKRSVEYTDEELVELNPDNLYGGQPRAEAVPKAERQKTFNSLAAQCYEREYKPNWARLRYQSIYGEWPSRDNGISMPRFFFKYEKEYKRRLKQQREQALGGA
jgi:superfamily II DNA or RNA helicase